MVIGLRPGRLRRWYWLPSLLIASALVVTIGIAGVVLGGVVLVWRWRTQPPPFGVVIITSQDAANALWLDRQRIVLGSPYRVIYRDEVGQADYCRLRRLCLGLPE